MTPVFGEMKLSVNQVYMAYFSYVCPSTAVLGFYIIDFVIGH